MATEVLMPALGMNQETGRLIEWLKREGETVSRGEPLMEVETDKATVAVEAPASGVLARVTARPGDDVPVGQPVAVILSPDETLSLVSLSPSGGEGVTGEGGGCWRARWRGGWPGSAASTSPRSRAAALTAP